MFSCKAPHPSGISETGYWEYEAYPGGLSMSSNDSLLTARFRWATTQALSYVHDGDDPVGKWYEAALPNREAFCMRDVSHQSQGAYYLGLAEHTKNMLYKFAENISESKDWCSYWEINRYNQPAPVDYASDEAFWYNLPANFDVLLACYNQYLLTGDMDYLEHPVFVRFYQKSLDDYIETWHLDIDRVMDRQRFMNLDSPLDSSNSFQVSRGLPSYGEGDPLRLFMGADLLCLNYQAYQSYQSMLRLKGLEHQADSVMKIAQSLQLWYNDLWWNSEKNIPHSSKLTDGTFRDNPSRYILQSNILMSPDRKRIALDGLLNRQSLNIESQSYLPKLFFQWDQNERAFKELLDISHPMKERREYPEVSFACIEAMVEGLMGLNIDAATRTVKTLSRLTTPNTVLKFKSIPAFRESASITHHAANGSTFESDSQEEISWVAQFYGSYDSLWSADQPIKASQLVLPTGRVVSFIELVVPPKARVTVSTKRNSKSQIY